MILLFIVLSFVLYISLIFCCNWLIPLDFVEVLKPVVQGEMSFKEKVYGWTDDKDQSQ